MPSALPRSPVRRLEVVVEPSTGPVGTLDEGGGENKSTHKKKKSAVDDSPSTSAQIKDGYGLFDASSGGIEVAKSLD